ncbi:MAG: hypothetical protein IH586_17080 [Anaerolineaceae bacterium]|nr:hypothetical protein [Anaerolineaceae bacterium]
MDDLVTRASRSMHRRWSHARSNAHIRRLSHEIAVAAAAATSDASNDVDGKRPVVFFNASTRTLGLSLNAAYSLVARWAVSLAGVPVINFACQSGMSRCVLGTDRDDLAMMPPCEYCTRQSQALFAHSQTEWFGYEEDGDLLKALSGLELPELMAFKYENIPLGALALPSIRWILRRQTLQDDWSTRYLFSEYILSAWRVGQEFGHLLDRVNPQAVVVFNGMFFPEAAARWAALRRGIRVISHEVGLRPFTAFFTQGDATAYPIHIPHEFELNDNQNMILDAYLENRMQGNFTMAGVRFWPEMRRLDQEFLDRAEGFRQVVPVFTNVIFDTSQPHSNVIFTDMFDWLEKVIGVARAHPDTLFVIRAHPDETRPGKESRESVADWVRQKRVLSLPNVIFVHPQEYFSSYELIQRSKFVMVYNSTIGLEASLMGVPVLCGGKARFTQLSTVFFPDSAEEYVRKADEFIAAEKIAVPPEFQQNARRFLYYQLYQTSLPFDRFIEEDGIWQGYVRIKDLDYRVFDPAQSAVLQTIVNGICLGTEFLFDE